VLPLQKLNFSLQHRVGVLKVVGEILIDLRSCRLGIVDVSIKTSGRTHPTVVLLFLVISPVWKVMLVLPTEQKMVLKVLIQ
jgi:hypothetical protein